MANPPRMLTLKGVTKTLREWSKTTKIPAKTITSRLNDLGWSVERALTTPVVHRAAPRVDRIEGCRPVPQLKIHVKGQAYVVWRDAGRRYYKWFGLAGTEQAQAGYRRFCLEWIESRGKIDQVVTYSNATVADLALRFLKWCVGEYRKFERLTSEYYCMKSAIKVLVTICGHKPVMTVTPEDLRLCQSEMVRRGWVRRSINLHTWRIKNCFRKGLEWGMVEAVIYDRLRHVPGLRIGRAGKESTPVEPVPEADFVATLERLPEPYRSLARLHRLIGCRSQELCGMSVEDVDRSQSEWRYVVPSRLNKNAHRDRPQVYWLGPQTIAILGPLLDARGSGFVFPGKSKPSLPPTVYARTIKRVCQKHGIPHWHPHQLRHNRASDVRRIYESEASAAAAIGDTPDVAGRIYGPEGSQVARRIARETS